MTYFALITTVLVIAYLLGSIPTALIISRKIRQIDIRSVGDGNMGAHNTFHEIGPKYGIIVAVIDFSKGAIPVFGAYILGLDTGWQILTGILVILGHDFPVFASFKGGQGLATSLGTMLVLFPLPTLIGLIAYFLSFLIIRNSSFSFSIGGAVIALIMGFSHQWLLLGYAVTVFLFVPTKLLMDRNRRKVIEMVKPV